MNATMTTTEATAPATITITPANEILAAGVMDRDGWRTGGHLVPAGVYRIIRRPDWLYVIQDVRERAGDAAGTYYYVNRRDVAVLN